MEYKENCRGRWIFFFGGLFWCLIVPLAYYLAFSQLIKESIGTIIFVSIAMFALFIGALVVLLNGISMLISNGKKHLVLYDEYLQLTINSGKRKGKTYDIDYEKITDFYFISNGTKLDKITKKYYVKENSSGIINFNVGNQYYCAQIYNALPAAEFILKRLQDEQIDKSRNELDKNGDYSPKA